MTYHFYFPRFDALISVYQTRALLELVRHLGNLEDHNNSDRGE